MEKYLGGFSTHGKHPIETVEWLLNEKESNDNKLLFQAYDANLYPLPNLSKWKTEEYKNKQISKGLEITKDFDGEVWLDDVRIK